MDTELVIEESAQEDAEREQEYMRERVEAFGQSLAYKLQDAIRARAESGIERRWSHDLDLYHGMDGARSSKDGDIFETIGGKDGKQKRRSRVFVQITREKTNAASARLSDMLFPTNDRNWELAPTPVPSLVSALKDMGNVQIRDPQPGPLTFNPVNADERIQPFGDGLRPSRGTPLTHFDGEQVAFASDPERSRARPDDDACAVGKVDQSPVGKVTNEEADPIPAHFRDAAIGVAVVHEPLSLGGIARNREGRRLVGGVRLGSYGPDHTVTTNTGVAMGEGLHLGLTELKERRGVRMQDEIVPGRVTLGRAGGQSQQSGSILDHG